MNIGPKKWQIGLVKSCHLGGIFSENWSIETSDRYSFFNPLEQSFGIEFLEQEESIDEVGYVGSYSARVRMKEGAFSVRQKTRFSDNRVEIEQSLRCDEDSLFQDFVMRFCFKKSDVKYAKISGKEIEHASKNIWHQYPVDRVELFGKSDSVSIRLVSAETSGKFQAEMYVRDDPSCWVVHARFIPTPPYSIEWIRWHNRLFSLSFGSFISSTILRFRCIRKFLWFRAERTGRKPNLQAQALAALKKGQSLSMTVVIE